MSGAPLPPGAATAAAELARRLRSIGETPAGRAALRGLESALPEASAIVRSALEDPAATIGDLLAPMAAAAAAELRDADRTIANGIAKALRKAFEPPTRKER